MLNDYKRVWGFHHQADFVNTLYEQNLSLRPLEYFAKDKPQALSKLKTKNDESEVIRMITVLNESYYTVSEVAEMFRVHSNTILEWIKQDYFPSVKIRNRYYIPETAIAKLMNGNKADKTAKEE